jgi:protein gp37
VPRTKKTSKGPGFNTSDSLKELSGQRRARWGRKRRIRLPRDKTMGTKSSIEWTDSTWNPVTGCTRVSAGCDNCYASSFATFRLKKRYLARAPVIDSVENVEDPFAVRIWPERLGQPGSWRNPRMVFVNSMSDLFHADIPEGFQREIFAVMVKEDRHIYQVLTKRPGRAARFLRRNLNRMGIRELPEHIWIGASVENQGVAHRVKQIKAVPAEVRFLSCEPLLGPVNLDLEGINWVIAGGESGGGYRPTEEEWVRSIRDQCLEGGVPFFFKQWGGRTSKAGGRLLDGRTWDEMPEPAERLEAVA